MQLEEQYKECNNVIPNNKEKLIWMQVLCIIKGAVIMDENFMLQNKDNTYIHFSECFSNHTNFDTDEHDNSIYMDSFLINGNYINRYL